MTKEEQIKAWFDKNIDFTEAKRLSVEVDKEIRLLDYHFLLYFIYDFDNENCRLTRLNQTIIRVLRNLTIKPIEAFNLLQDTLIKKNRDYGNSFDRSMDKFGWVYLAMELDKKKNRLKNLLKNKQAPNYESLDDTLLDIAGYCVLALIYLENKECE